MSIETKVQLKCALSNGTTAVINLPAPFNGDMKDEDTGNYLYPDAHASIVAAFASDSGATIDSISYNIIETRTDTVAENYRGN